jgi:hypothetical protein
MEPDLSESEQDGKHKRRAANGTRFPARKKKKVQSGRGSGLGCDLAGWIKQWPSVDGWAFSSGDGLWLRVLSCVQCISHVLIFSFWLPFLSHFLIVSRVILSSLCFPLILALRVSLALDHSHSLFCAFFFLCTSPVLLNAFARAIWD